MGWVASPRRDGPAGRSFDSSHRRAEKDQMRDLVAQAGGDSPCHDAAPAMTDEDGRPGPGLEPGNQLPFDPAAQTLGTAGVYRQR